MNDHPTPRVEIDAVRTIWESLDLVVASGVEHEVRTTVYPHATAARDAFEVARRVCARGEREYALQQVRSTGTRADFADELARWDAHAWDAECRQLAAQIAELGFERFTYRDARSVG
ncbi:hypothetical protein [Georgenia wangjunii]|uniref:hypothetical protein n=1 Tax=Georgenia wangjunii TaxID=3117730 RepID=UPI002F266C90